MRKNVNDIKKSDYKCPNCGEKLLILGEYFVGRDLGRIQKCELCGKIFNRFYLRGFWDGYNLERQERL